MPYIGRVDRDLEPRPYLQAMLIPAGFWFRGFFELGVQGLSEMRNLIPPVWNRFRGFGLGLEIWG